MTAVLDERLLALLVDPEDKQPLWFFAEQGLLYNERTRRVYEVKQNIAVMLVDDSRIADDAEHTALTASAEAAAVRTGAGL